MSLITDDPDESPRDCSRSRTSSSSWKHHHHHHGPRRLWRRWPSSSCVSPCCALQAPASHTVDSNNANSSAAVIVVNAALNPNAHATALYDRLQANASYAGVALGAGEALLLRVRIQGQLRWKVAAWVSARHGLTVDCIAAVMLQQPPGPQQQQQVSSSPSQCATHVL